MARITCLTSVLLELQELVDDSEHLEMHINEGLTTQSLKLHTNFNVKRFSSQKILFPFIKFIDHFYSPPLSKVHYGGALYSSRKIKNRLTSKI